MRRRRTPMLVVATLVMAAWAGGFPFAEGEETALAPPVNDDCAGAIPIPSTPLPQLTSPVNLTDATGVGDPGLCQPSSKTIWYSFIPGVTGDYVFTTCPGQAPATNLYSTVLAIFTAPGCAGAFTNVDCRFRGVMCGEEVWQPRLTAHLTAGTVYFIVVGSISAPSAGRETVQLSVSLGEPPSNDTCGTATPVTLNLPAAGTLMLAGNDYGLPASTTCYALPAGPPAPIGQLYSSGPGREVVYSFTPQASGSYNVRAQHWQNGCDLVLYATSACEAGAPPVEVTSCIGAANRNTNAGSWTVAEELVCLPMNGGQTYYVYVDENCTAANQTEFLLEVRDCALESEPNDTPATAGADPSGIGGSTGKSNDFDYVSLGSPPAGTRVFAMADQLAGNTQSMRMRITDTVNTLEFDDNDNQNPWGNLSPNIAGRPLNGDEAFIQVSPNSTTTMSEPYRLTYVLQPPGAGLGGSSATPESSNVTAGGNMFFSGELNPAGDADYFQFCARAGDEIFLSLDGDPLRDNTPLDGTILFWNTLLRGQAYFEDNAASNTTPGAGSLTAVTPFSPGDAMLVRAQETGRYRASVTSYATGAAAMGDYLLSISVNGRNGALQSVDLAVAAAGAPDPVPVGETTEYTVTVTNATPDFAQVATLTAPLPPGTTFMGVQQAGSGGAWTCVAPAVGANGTITCTNACFEGASSATFTITLRVNHCLSDGTVLDHVVNVTTVTPEPLPGDNEARFTTTVANNESCDDADACTVDSCDASLGCLHAAIPLPAEVNESLDVSLTGTDALVSWADPPGPFSVYRGALATSGPWAYNHACLGEPGESPHVDPDTPGLGLAYYYLVSRQNSCGQESIVGRDSNGAPQPNPNPCP